MKTVPIFTTCNNNQSVKDKLKSDGVLRVYQFGLTPDLATIKRPYAVWQLINGQPENYLAHRPDVEQHAIQINVYGTSATQAREALNAIEYALETVSHVTNYHDENRDKETLDYSVGMDIDWHLPRD